MTSMIYTKNTSGAIRRLRNKKPTKGYLSALIEHIKFLKSLGFKFDSKGKIKKRQKKSAPLAHSVEQLICNQQVICSNQIGGTTTKPSDNWRLKESKKFSKDTIVIVNSCGDAYKDRGIIEKRLGKKYVKSN